MTTPPAYLITLVEDDDGSSEDDSSNDDANNDDSSNDNSSNNNGNCGVRRTDEHGLGRYEDGLLVLQAPCSVVSSSLFWP